MIDLTTLKEWLGIPATDTAHDALLTDLEAQAVEWVERQTGRYFGPPAETTEVIRGTGARRLWLAEPPVSVAEVTEVVYPGGTETVIDPAGVNGYEVRVAGNEGWLVRRGGVWWPCYEYRVRYTRGYPTGQEPADIRQLVLDLVALRWSLRGKDGLQSESIGGYSYTRSAFHIADDGDLKSIPGALRTIQAWRRNV